MIGRPVVQIQGRRYFSSIDLFFLYVTGFVKSGLSHTSNSINLKDCNLGLKAHANLKFSLPVSPHYHPNFKTI